MCMLLSIDHSPRCKLIISPHHAHYNAHQRETIHDKLIRSGLIPKRNQLKCLILGPTVAILPFYQKKKKILKLNGHPEFFEIYIIDETIRCASK